MTNPKHGCCPTSLTYRKGEYRIWVNKRQALRGEQQNEYIG